MRNALFAMLDIGPIHQAYYQRTLFLTNDVRALNPTNMNQQNPRTIVSRRDRPAKAPLSRDVIISTALEILTREGLSGLSMRKVAAALDTGPASLYVYIANLEELHALVLDLALAEVVLSTDRNDDWRTRLKAVMKSYFFVIFSRPGLGQLAMATIPCGPNAMRMTEMLLDLLLEGGVVPAVAAWAVDLILLHVTAIAAEQSVRRNQESPVERVALFYESNSGTEHPHIQALHEDLFSGGGTRFDWALDVLINGVVHTPNIATTLTSGDS